MVQALKYCQEQKVMHRDLKLENIILTSNNQIKFIDFGVSKVLKDGASLASTFAGTPHCMAPEIIKGSKYSFPCDIWNLGIIIYELLTFKKPFISKTQLDLNNEICTQDPPAITVKYTHDLIDIVKAMLLKNPFTRIKLTKIVKHPTLWNFQEDANEKVESLERELKEQKDLVENLQKEIEQLKSVNMENQKLQEENERLKSVEMENQNLQKENERLKSVQTKNEKEIQDLKKRFPQKLVEEGMELLRKQLWDENAQKAAFFLFKIAADDGNCPQASWRVAACYLQEIGIEQNFEQARKYSQIAFQANLPDGIFWYALCRLTPFNETESFEFFQQGAEQNHLASKYYVEFCIFQGLGTPDPNEIEGKKLMQSFFDNQNDAFWTFVYAKFCEDGQCNFEKDAKKAKTLYRKLNKLPICDCSIFKPTRFPNSCLKEKW
jgi:serine/threonine protein kinase